MSYYGCPDQWPDLTRPATTVESLCEKSRILRKEATRAALAARVEHAHIF